MESQDSSQETQPEVPEPESARPARDLIAQLIPLHPTADYVDLVTVPFTFGRLKTSNFVINDKRISATHCTFTKRGEHIYVEDQSTNGTYINQKILGKGNAIKLKTGDVIAFVEKDGYGTFSYVFYDVCAPPPSADKVFKEYIVECVLGNGNFGVVQRVKRISSGELFAMKVIDKMKLMASYNKMDENNTLMEVHILKILRHPNIISVVEVCDTPRYVYLILELADQGELFEKIFNQGCYSEREGKLVFRQILDAITYLHDNNIAHRDLKPENILLHNNNGESVVKVSDFGLAKILGEFQSTKTLCGTPMYVAPEMLAHSRFLQGDKTVGEKAKNGYGKEVDAWSLGCILYIILSGRPPFNDPIPKDLFEHIAAGDFEMTEEPWPRISDDAKDLISKLLVVDPAKRLTVRGALNHQWFSELSDLPLHSNVEKSKHDKNSKDNKTDKSNNKTENKYDATKQKVSESESYRTSLKPQNRQNSSNRENMENMKSNNERRNSGTLRTESNAHKYKESSKEIEKEREGNRNREDTKRGSFKETMSRDPENHREEGRNREESKKVELSERSSDEESLVLKTMERPKRRETSDLPGSLPRPESRTESRTENRTENRTESRTESRTRPKPNEIEPLTTTNKESKSSRHESSKDGKKETKSVHSIFALPTTPSTKTSPHKSPRKQSRKLELVRATPAEKSSKDTRSSPTSSSLPSSSPLQNFLKTSSSQEKHSSSKNRFAFSSRKLQFAPQSHTGSLFSGLGSDDDAKKRKLALAQARKDEDFVVIEDDESAKSSGKRQRILNANLQLSRTTS